jgi:DNA-binding transcriptional LysR family regulator
VLSWRFDYLEPGAMHDLNDVQFFVAVAENQGFSAAARVLNMPKSSVSRRVANLEARLGVRLIERSTRSLRLTEVGVSFYERCRAILADLDTAEREVAVQRAEPVGLVRMSCPTGLAQFVLAKILPGFLIRYPKVRLQVLATNRAIDLVDDNIDIAIRARMRTADEAVMMRMLYKGELIFVASPAFASAQQIAIRIDTLPSFPFLSFLEEPRRPTWALNGPNAATATVSLDPVLRSSDFSVLLSAAAAGLGIALLPAEVADDDIRAKRLIRILPDWHSDEITVHLVFATNRGIVPAVRVLIDYLAEHFKFPQDQRPAKKQASASHRLPAPRSPARSRLQKPPGPARQPRAAPDRPARA